MKRLFVACLVAGCASPTTPTVAREGEAQVTVGKVSEPSPISAPASTPARRMAPKATRSRPSAKAPVTGSLTDTTCYTATGHRTASGLWPQVGMAASNRYPFGTRLRVQGVGVVTVQDRIGHGSSLDLFGPTEAFCRNFGRRQLRVQVIR